MPAATVTYFDAWSDACLSAERKITIVVVGCPADKQEKQPRQTYMHICAQIPTKFLIQHVTAQPMAHHVDLMVDDNFEFCMHRHL